MQWNKWADVRKLIIILQTIETMDVEIKSDIRCGHCLIAVTLVSAIDYYVCIYMCTVQCIVYSV